LKVVSFYRFFDLEDPKIYCESLQTLCDENNLLGTVLLAEEGFNCTLAGNRQAVMLVLAWLKNTFALKDPIEVRWAEAAEPPFRHMRVRLKKEIVTLGRVDIKPYQSSSRYLSTDDWNEFIDNPDTLVIDTRNHYEVEIGSFPNALNPGTDSFRQFPMFAEQLVKISKKQPIGIFCTGGIRCEKAAALMLKLGFQEVYQLKGGILKYLEQVTKENNRWNGECFVFDSRVAIDRDLAEGDYVQCHACRRPLSSEDLHSSDYREGISCPQCISELDEDRTGRLKECRHQIHLVRARGKTHIGAILPNDATKSGKKSTR
jgi:UPF0176 protein